MTAKTPIYMQDELEHANKMRERMVPQIEAARAMLAALGEGDTLSQNILELLREYAEEDNWAVSLMTQLEAFGSNARAAIAQAEAAGIGEK